MVDHQVDGHQRIDPLRIAAEAFHGTSHGRQINDGGHAGEVLKHDRAGLNGTSMGVCRTGCQPARLRTSVSVTW